MIGAIVVTIVFIFPLAFAGLFDALVSNAAGGVPVLGVLVGFLFYLVMYTVVIFCNTALIGAAMIRLEGGDPAVSDGFRIAFAHIGPIVGYALISATVGMILRARSERAGVIGRIVISIIGFAWNVVTFLVVLVLVAEGVGPVEAIRRSGALLRKTWGEQLIGNFSISMILGLLTVVVLIAAVPLIVAAVSAESIPLVVMVILLVVVLVTGIGLIGSALGGIYAAVVYRYAASGEASAFFSAELVQGAFRST